MFNVYKSDYGVIPPGAARRQELLQVEDQGKVALIPWLLCFIIYCSAILS